MDKSEIGDRLAHRLGLSKAAASDTVDAMFEAIGEARAKGDDVQIVGFGTFGTR